MDMDQTATFMQVFDPPQFHRHHHFLLCQHSHSFRNHLPRRRTPRRYLVPAALDATRSASGTSLSTERLQRLVFVFVFTFAKGFGENMVFIKTGRGVSKGSKKTFFLNGVLHLVCSALGMSTAVRTVLCICVSVHLRLPMWFRGSQWCLWWSRQSGCVSTPSPPSKWSMKMEVNRCFSLLVVSS